jgi:selenocysteine lyase/cysteine desulfurase
MEVHIYSLKPLLIHLYQTNEGKISRAGHIISIPIEGKDLLRIKKNLSDNKIIISFRGRFIRVSPYLFNNDSDMEKLIECLQ